MTENINIVYEAPEPKEYVNLRIATGLSPKNISTAAIAMKNSIFSVSLRDSNALVGMGRIIGDGGCFYQIVDIAVHPDYQGKGFGSLIMSEIMNYLNEHAPQDCYVSLIADVPADKLYKKFGFEYTQPRSVGMFKKY
ncbi:GNAT family N-acetyltransferase [Paenibacillus faecalis]|uniref:GNAT family N-acetyltransferase n=1 Tax=Paenibacillus faecalis TaxID=2079532 RepID=UPI000D0F451A|nr:GNAT family N-acetyltransferase [Paenibacillus faecalis]